MKNILPFFVLILFTSFSFGQKIGIKNNLVYDAALTPNLGIEFGLGNKMTLDFNVNYNPFTYDKQKKIKHWLVQPELRWWFCERFNAGFIGLHAMGGEYCFSNIKLPFGMYKVLRDYRYEGYYYGGGISIGHQWMIGKRWNFEASVGGGFVRLQYDKYACQPCGPKLDKGHKNYWGVTKATLSFVYILW